MGVQTKWSEQHTSYELCSLSKNIIYELLLNFNGNMDKLDELIVDMKNKYLRPDK